MEKYDLLLRVLRNLQSQGLLKHLVLVGSWCLDVYRQMYEETTSIPATRTMDADILVPKRLPRKVRVDVHELMENQGFITHTDYPLGFHRFVHPELNVEFLTNAGAKSDASVYQFKQLGIVAQELRYMNIPLQWSTSATIDGIEIRIPEPEAFALHKLIVMGLRDDPEKATKDREAAQGLFLFFEDKPERVARLKEIYASFPKGWRKKVDAGLKKAKIGVEIA